MVVLAASVCTKSGQAVVSRQYVEMTRSRIEGLLASFPKLIVDDGNSQHTFVETDAVRYIYQPLDDLYMVLVTNKQSNILQDISTLNLFARIVSEYCRSLKESEISRQSFDLIMAFDEIISIGYRENVSVQEIRTNTEMESHEERLQEMLQKSKEREATENAKLKAKQLDMQRREMKRKGSNHQLGGSLHSMSSHPISMGAPLMSSTSSSSQQWQSNVPSASSGSSQKRGMQLGAKNKTGGMFEAIRQDEGITDDMVQSMNAVSVSASSPVQTNGGAIAVPAEQPKVKMGDVHVGIEEKITATLHKDGGIENLEAKGEVHLRVANQENSLIKLNFSLASESGIQFKTHPNVDKSLWSTETSIAPKDKAKPFALNTSLPVLKWRFSSKDESLVPLSVNVWPSPNNDGSFDCSVEFELLDDRFELNDVIIQIPIPHSGGQPTVNSIDGDYQFQVGARKLDWHISKIDTSNTSGTLEFTISANSPDDANELFPVTVNFQSPTTLCQVKLLNVTKLENQSEPVDFTSQVSVYADRYTVV